MRTCMTGAKVLYACYIHYVICHFPMKKVGCSLDKTRAGFIKLVPEDPDDIWTLYNTVFPEDIVESTTFR